MCLCELLNTLIGSEMEKNKHQPPPAIHKHTHTRMHRLSLASCLYLCARFLNPTMLVKAWGRVFRRSNPITAVLSQKLLARWSLSVVYGVARCAIRTVPYHSTPDVSEDVCWRRLVLNTPNHTSLSMQSLCRKMIIIDINHVPL